ncbi:DUF6252 family protein [Flavobacterium marginilacus]|uniref:DUF6252 family protein n=1 Tax=Flavobacterium marginilacus TaxID=3003256 RepID=UPI00248E4EC4|nr:DUF6252 family protein [Flavobacterium marginilacus]
MRRFFLITILLFILASCEDQVKFNNPAVQGLKDNIIWRAGLFNITQSSDGSLTIIAYQKNDALLLKTAGNAVKTYPLGTDTASKVALTEKTDGVTTVFSTGKNIGNGQITITEWDAVNHTVTGEFNFNAKNESTNPSAKPNVNFQKGVFYKVPVTTETNLTKNTASF